MLRQTKEFWTSNLLQTREVQTSKHKTFSYFDPLHILAKKNELCSAKIQNLVNNGVKPLATFRYIILRASMYACIDLAHLYEDKNQTDWTLNLSEHHISTKTKLSMKQFTQQTAYPNTTNQLNQTSQKSWTPNFEK